jgi:imidazolonepropionase-like amidohydrolase
MTLRRAIGLGLAALFLASSAASLSGFLNQARPAAQSATLLVHLLERPIGRETSEWRQDGQDLLFTSEMDLAERDSRLKVSSSLRLQSDLTPVRFRVTGNTYRFVNADLDVQIAKGEARIQNLGHASSERLPRQFFTALGYAPLSARALLVRYWERQGRPDSLRLLPGDETREVSIEFRGEDTVRTGDRSVRLRRYSVNGVVWGRESVWLDDRDGLAALITRIHILPLEAVREDLKDALPALQRAAIADRMVDLARMATDTPVIAQGHFAIIGVTLLDGTDWPPVDDATVIVRDGRIEEAGPRSSVEVPEGLNRIDARGKTVMPGLWDMHAHASQIEWAPAYLAAGVTSVRDMGGEQAFLTAFRDVLAAPGTVGPRLFLAGLIDGTAAEAFGTTTASSPAEGRAAVDRYRAAGFNQIKLYTRLQPDVASAIVARAHEVGMTVAGHIPTSMDVKQAVESGMDHIAHLPLRGDPGSPEVRATIALLGKRGTVVDPTLPWNELLNRAPDTAIETFEPGILQMPVPLASSYRSIRNKTDSAAAAARRRDEGAIVKALHAAGVPIVAGTDGGVPGFSLWRTLELYVEAGLTPLEALQTATLAPARAMGVDSEVGTIEPGKRADLLVLDANPLTDISYIRHLRYVVVNGRMYHRDALWRSAGFAAPR